MEAFFEIASNLQDESLLLVRIVLGVAFIFAARNKSRDMQSFARNDELPLPVAYLVTYAEAAAGIGLLLGILPRLAAVGIMMLMIGSMSFHILKWKSPYWASEGGWEYDLMIFTLAGVIATAGAGVYTLYAPF